MAQEKAEVLTLTDSLQAEELQRIVKKLKSRGYWRINSRPRGHKDQRIRSVSGCKEIVEESLVQLGCSDYPYFPGQDEPAEVWSGHNYAELCVDCADYMELWRMYTSGQFIHFLSLREDWVERGSRQDQETKAIEPGTVLGMRETVHTLTRICEFLARLAEHGIYKEGIDVEVVLHNMRSVSRALQASGEREDPGARKHVSAVKEMSFSKQYSEEEVRRRPRDLAIDMVLEVFHFFEWEKPPMVTIRRDQARLWPKAS